MQSEVIELLEETFYLQAGEIGEDTPLQEFIRDSIDAVELIAVLSSRYAIQIDPAALSGVESVGDVIRYVESAARQTERVPLESF